MCSISFESTDYPDGRLTWCAPQKNSGSEWEQLHGLSEANPALRNRTRTERFAARRQVLDDRPTLMIDTRQFEQSFTDRLLSGYEDLDAAIDGLLLQGDNFHALTLLAAPYARKVAAVYIDPPYNTSGSEILYKNSYKHSTWLTLIANRLHASRGLIAADAIQCTMIDDAESARLHLLLNQEFGSDRYLATVPIRSKPQGRAVPPGFSPNHEYAIFHALSVEARVGRLPRGERQLLRYRERDEKGIFTWANFRKTGSDSLRTDRRKSFYPVYVHASGRRAGSVLRSPPVDDGARHMACCADGNAGSPARRRLRFDAGGRLVVEEVSVLAIRAASQSLATGPPFAGASTYTWDVFATLDWARGDDRLPGERTDRVH